MKIQPERTVRAAAVAIGAALAAYLAAPVARPTRADLWFWDATDRAFARSQVEGVHVCLVSGAPSADEWTSMLELLSRRRPAGVLIDVALPEPDEALLRAVRATRAILRAIPDDSGESFPERARLELFGPADHLPEARRVRPMPRLADAAAGCGIADLVPDADGVVRRVGLLSRGDGARDAVPSLVLAAMSVGFGDSSVQLARDGRRLIGLAGTDVPIDGEAALWLRFRGPGAIPATTAPFEDVRSGEFVVIGGGDETVRTPVDPNMPRAEVLATALSNLVRADPLAPPEPALSVLHAAVTALLAAFSGFARWRHATWIGLFLAGFATSALMRGIGWSLAPTLALSCGAVALILCRIVAPTSRDRARDSRRGPEASGEDPA